MRIGCVEVRFVKPPHYLTKFGIGLCLPFLVALLLGVAFAPLAPAVWLFANGHPWAGGGYVWIVLALIGAAFVED